MTAPKLHLPEVDTALRITLANLPSPRREGLEREIAEIAALRAEVERLTKALDETNARWSRFYYMAGTWPAPSLAEAERIFPQHGTDAFLETLYGAGEMLAEWERERGELEKLRAVAEAAQIYDGLCTAYDNELCSREMVEDAYRQVQAALRKLDAEGSAT